MSEHREDIYDRQKRIPGWDQDRIRKSVVTIVGSDELARECAIPLAAMGVGSIIMIGNKYTKKDEMFLDIDLEAGKYRVFEWEKSFNKIFLDTDFIPIETFLESKTAIGLIEGSDVVVDVTNSSTSKVHCAMYGLEKKVPVILAGCRNGYFKALSVDLEEELKKDYVMPRFNGLPQDEFISIVGGGIVAEEVKKILFNSDFVFDEPLYFKLGGQDRFSYITYKDGFSYHPLFCGKNALVIGDGALCASGGARILAKQGYARIDHIDMDTVEPTNLNRQIGHHGSIGRDKVSSIIDFMHRISKGKTRYNGWKLRFDESFKSDIKYDVIFDWVDNLYTRALVSVFAIRNKIPLITAATDYQSGEWATYAIGKTRCMNDYFGIHEMGAEEERIRRASCMQAPDPSIVTSNRITGSASALEAGCLFYPDVYGEPINGILKYSSVRGKKLGLTVFNEICNCHEKEIKDIVI